MKGVLAEAGVIGGVSEQGAARGDGHIADGHEGLALGEFVYVKEDLLGLGFVEGNAGGDAAAMDGVLETRDSAGVVKKSLHQVGNGLVCLFDVGEHLVVELLLERGRRSHEALGEGILGVEIGESFRRGFVAEPGVIVGKGDTVEDGALGFGTGDRSGSACYRGHEIRISRLMIGNFVERRRVESGGMLRITRVLLGVVLLLSFGHAGAETVASLPAPTGYVNDFAGVLQPGTKQRLEDLCTQIDQKAKAQIAVVTISKIDSDESIEEFAVALEEKWKVGAKGSDRGVLMLFVMNPRGGRIEVGYGLEGILNDAKVGDIGRTMSPAARANDYDTAIPLGVSQMAQVIAADAGVALTQPQMVHRYHEQQVGTQVHLSFWQVVIGGGVVLLILIFLISTGNAGWIFFILMNMIGGGGGGGGGRGNDDRGGGGGFGGFGGGSSGGGGASGDW